MAVKVVPLYFKERNEREEREYEEQLIRLKELYGEEMELLESAAVGDKLPEQAEAILFPQMIFAAFRHDGVFRAYKLPIIVLTSSYGSIEMWDWEIVTYLKDLGCLVFAPYSVEMAKVILRALSVKSHLAKGARFLLFQDTPGEGKQANIFKKFYWWEKESTRIMEETFGCKILYYSWKKVNERAEAYSMEQVKSICADWEIAREEVSDMCFYHAVRLYIAIKETAEEMGGVDGVGANCLNESFYSKTTPCLAWNMLFEKDHMIWACEGDTLTLLSTFIIYKAIEKPVMMTNLYPFLMGMAALAHEKIQSFPEIEEPDKYALGVHCGYFGFAPRQFCSEWTLRPKVLEIVNGNACMVDCRMEKGPVTLAKIYPGFRKLSLIKAQLEDYVQYPGSDCRNGALIRYENGYRVMEELCSHHSLIIQGDVTAQLRQVAKVFCWEVIEM